MRKITALIVFVFCVTATLESVAQMSKAEAKAWKKKVKKLQPQQYKDLVDENKKLKSQAANLKTELSNVDAKMAEKDEKISQYQGRLSDLKGQLSKAREQKKVVSVPKNTNETRGTIDESKGLVFKVQIGAFTKKDLSKYLDNARNFSGEEENGVRKYTIGVFRDYWDADTFKKYLREMGVKDAWIVAYKEGSRVPIKDVLEGISKS